MNAAKLREVVQQLAGTYNKDFVSITLCEVTSTSNAETDGVIDCIPISGDSITDMPAVKLKAEANDGFMLIPSVGSTVLVASSTRNNYYLLMCSDIDKVVCTINNNNYFVFSSDGFIFNGGTLDGMVKINDLVTKLNNLENKVNSLLTAFNSHVHPGVTVGAGSTAITITPVTGTLTPTTRPDLENPKIKQ
jgi:hypothetical protein